MGKKEQIQYWIKTSDEDWKSVLHLIKSKFYVQALFFSHLVIEKLLKAHWLVANEGVPPHVHNLVYLHDQSNLNLSAEYLQLLNVINSWNLDGRYPDYKKSFHKIASPKFVKTNMALVAKLRQCLLEEL